MFPSQNQFEKQVGELGINNETKICVYDTNGLSASRVYWMFRFFGHDQISLLDGGFSSWKSEFPNQIESGEPNSIEKTKFVSNFDSLKIKTLSDILENLKSQNFDVVDARSVGRFTGRDPEPREGLKSGSIPNSFNVFFQNVYDKDGKFKTKEELKELFTKSGIDFKKPIIASCGSGVSACVLLTALEILEIEKKSLYDGSWTEYAMTQKL
jgi:thiosulfate/3-mercaptopyruvate sulfurtransferase